MTPDQRFTLIMFALGLVSSMLVWVLKTVAKFGRQWISTGYRLEEFSRKFAELVESETSAHADLHKRIDRHEDYHGRG